MTSAHMFANCIFCGNLDKQKTSKEEAREIQLREEANVRDKVKNIQKNLSLLLKALGEMAITNPVFTHSELPSLVSFFAFYNI